jgi:hypothetical protein
MQNNLEKLIGDISTRSLSYLEWDKYFNLLKKTISDNMINFDLIDDFAYALINAKIYCSSNMERKTLNRKKACLFNICNYVKARKTREITSKRG